MKSQAAQAASRVTQAIRSIALLVVAAAALASAPAEAQLPIPATTQFDVTGFLKVATLDATCAGNAHCGGSLVVNGLTIVVPRETIVILPANALTWQGFSLSPAPYTGVATGMAIDDVPAPIATYEVHVVGNRIVSGGKDRYIAGLVNIGQQALNSGTGFINFMDYSTGEMRVGGILNDPTTGAPVRINDPAGRYGRVMSPDPRFTVDAENPTIAAGTGYPMCFPRAAPLAVGESDPLCPSANRPGGWTFTMTDPALHAFPSPLFQAPLQVGDFVTFSGTLVNDSATPTVAVPGATTYISAHTIITNVAIYTWPGTNPAYILLDVSLIGTGGLNVLGAGEAASRTRFEGMTTDPSRNVHLYGVDLDPITGAATDRDWGTIGVDPGPPTGAQKGRWRFRPPCKGGAVDMKNCSPPPLGVFTPPTREVRAVIEGLQAQAAPPAPAPRNNPALTASNGITWGQYHAPIAEYIFPENFPGTPIVANNFNSLPFLAQGGYTSATGVIVGQLNPWPDATVPSTTCTPVVANAGGPYTVAAGGSVQLSASASGTGVIDYLWSPAPSGSLSALNVPNPLFNTAGASGTVTLTLTATNLCGSSTVTTSVTVNPAGTPTVLALPAVTALSSTASLTLPLVGTDPNLPAQPLTFNVTQTGAPALILSPVVSTGATTANLVFGVPALPVGAPSAVITLTVTATNRGGATSAPVTTTVTINPRQDSILVTAVVYRVSNQRLIVNASSSVISPTVVLTLQPYLTVNGTVFDPTTLGNTFTNNGAGLYVLTLVGAPEPALLPATPIVVTSSLGGTSPPHGLDRVR